MFKNFQNALSDTKQYIAYSDIPYWLFGIFIGWNGIQLFFSNRLVDFLIRFSIVDFILSILNPDNANVNLFIFGLTSFVIVYLFFSILFELKLINSMKLMELGDKQITDIATNFFIPFIAFLIVFSLTFFIIAKGVFLLFHARYGTYWILLREYFIMMLLLKFFIIDFVLEDFIQSRNFITSLHKMIVNFMKHVVPFTKFMLQKFIFILISLSYFSLVLMLFDWIVNRFTFFNYSSPLPVFMSLNSIATVSSNLFVSITVIMISCVILAPVIQRLYLIHKYYKFRTFKFLGD